MICNTPPATVTSRKARSSARPGWATASALALSLITLLTGCGRRETASDDVWAMPAVAVSAPAAPGARYPHLAPLPGGGVVLSWVAPAGDGATALEYSTWSGDGWTVPGTVASGAGWFVNWADFPSMVPVGKDLWAAHWLEQRPGNVYSYDVRVAVSTDQGRSWSTPMSPHDDGTPTEHGFVSLARVKDGVAAIWLDGRNTGGGHEAEHGAAAGAMTLRTAVIDGQGRLSGGEAELDPRVCDCCQTDVAASAQGLVVAYRDRDAGEVRDISVVRATDAGWSAPTRVHRDDWRIAACPVNGPAIAAVDRTVAVAWFTARDEPRVRLAFSDDAGLSFAPPLEIDAGRVAGRVDLVLLDARRAVVSWLAETNDGAEIRAQLWTPTGAVGSPLIVGRSSVDRASGFPRMARVGETLLFAWTETGATPAVRTAMLRLR